MITSYIQLTLFTVMIAVITNYCRFKGSQALNKWILIVSSLVLVEIEGLLFEFIHTNWIMLVFIGVSVVCFHTYGGAVSACAAWLILFMHTDESDLFILFSYLIFATVVYLITDYIRNIQVESDAWLRKLSENSKQLNVFKEVSFSMQQTLNLQKLLRTILTSVTAGHGLGFNRAMILLIDESGTRLKGTIGTGPMTVEEGYAVWDRITKNKYKLVDLIEIKETEKSADLLLNERVKELDISLEEPNFLYKTLESGSPLHISEIDENDIALQLFTDQFNMSELVVFPLISQSVKVGVLIIDNPVNKKSITANDVDSVIPLATQAAIAIQHIHLYAKIEDMAHKDGLTGLLNQRAFQTSLDQHLPLGQQGTVSLILLDIDCFKHYNDTNGHLLGNQVLIQLADVIRNSIQEHDLAFRFGGEEFVILLPHTTKETAIRVAEQIRVNVESTSFPCGEKQPLGCLTISLGVASSVEFQSSTPFDLVNTADKALYKAKEAGRNKVVS
ncbi:diguanylate cyclase (GGDEF)-like protein [Paenibacillus sp. DS2015]|uniref:sensor domain-containing diguanylate cyclase n=1 Tax=Paenibacillus sp. DS2015 TaxID=3373917 RepID=UPI003D1E9E4B